ncbi:ABC transporter ATP-binding protein [Bacillus sp. KH172YL63]|uniref:ABC transporter ATP-binding protein n=1 Tax=Bacillus sp. KH172YL63 TaxID=2709784 RepID=UPI0013E50BCA|nr:dipeptide/oligopeptide/nickel ABC transporter ATP-binding protein [Bacillus sp. KH172YL63]BCB05272.1 ABC transporter ATP-binding protein [Bacillus sp. KH172YL63]
MENELLLAKELTKSYQLGTPVIKDVSFSISKGECVGLVGESGSGKSTLAHCLLGLEDVDRGKIEFLSTPISMIKGSFRRKTGRNLQAVFQQPSASLNPKLKIIDSLMEALDMQQSYGRHQRRRKGEELLDMVRLPLWTLDAYPHELSGGMKQRVNIARAVSTKPPLLILDEPTASLDVSVQASILNLFKDLQEELGLAFLFITHDLAAAAYMSDRILVMKDGGIRDSFQKEDIFAEERHPYTQELIRVFV